jgi:hypothetical protein
MFSAPTRELDVWRVLGIPGVDGVQDVTVLWKVSAETLSVLIGWLARLATKSCSLTPRTLKKIK